VHTGAGPGFEGPNSQQSHEQWRTAVPGRAWSDGSPMTLASVFAYRYRDLTHYGGHAEEIEMWLRELSV
jgi:hypothetical protein